MDGLLGWMYRWSGNLELLIVGFVLLVIVLSCAFSVDTMNIGVIQRFGKFVRLVNPGLNFKLPFIESVDRVNLQVEQVQVIVETKTKDNVFVKLPIAVQYRVLPDQVYDAYFKLDDPELQIKAYVANIIMGHVPKMTLDETFEQQTEMSLEIRTQLNVPMKTFGYEIFQALITDIEPDSKVVSAMNDINAAVREREATISRAETQKLMTVKQAEAEKESMRLQGEGVAAERKAIIEGLSESIKEFEEGTQVSAQQAMMMLLMTQYFDTLKSIAGNDHSTTVMLSSSPSAIGDFAAQFREALITGNALTPPVVQPAAKAA